MTSVRFWVRFLSTNGKNAGRKSPEIKTKVIGLGEKVFKVSATAVGPGADKSSAYKNPEYFCYNTFSYYEAENEMVKFRLPQPSPFQKSD